MKKKLIAILLTLALLTAFVQYQRGTVGARQMDDTHPRHALIAE